MVTVLTSLESKLSTRIENNPLNYVSEVECNVIIVTFPTDKVRMLLYRRLINKLRWESKDRHDVTRQQVDLRKYLVTPSVSL